jgi:hypothetical protein
VCSSGQESAPCMWWSMRVLAMSIWRHVSFSSGRENLEALVMFTGRRETVSSTFVSANVSWAEFWSKRRASSHPSSVKYQSRTYSNLSSFLRAKGAGWGLRVLETGKPCAKGLALLFAGTGGGWGGGGRGGVFCRGGGGSPSLF